MTVAEVEGALIADHFASRAPGYWGSANPLQHRQAHSLKFGLHWCRTWGPPQGPVPNFPARPADPPAPSTATRARGGEALQVGVVHPAQIVVTANRLYDTLVQRKAIGDREMPACEILVEQVMNTDVLAVTPGTTTMNALRQMAEKHVGSIVVIKNKKLMGIFTERDLLYKVVLAGKNPEQIPVREVMTRNVVSIAPDRSVESAMIKMAQGSFRHLLVVDNEDDIRGIVSIKDLARALRVQLVAGRRPAAERPDEHI